MSWSCEIGESRVRASGRLRWLRDEGGTASRAERMRGVVTRRTIALDRVESAIKQAFSRDGMMGWMVEERSERDTIDTSPF